MTIERNLDVIKTADGISGMGPEGGDAGGCVIAEGALEDVAQVESSHTGHYLTRVLNGAKVPFEK